MVAADYSHLDTTESATRTVLGLCFTITDLRDASIKSATSHLTFHLNTLETGQFASSARTTTTIQMGY